LRLEAQPSWFQVSGRVLEAASPALLVADAQPVDVQPADVRSALPVEHAAREPPGQAWQPMARAHLFSASAQQVSPAQPQAHAPEPRRSWVPG
jgi:hypothetical protein